MNVRQRLALGAIRGGLAALNAVSPAAAARAAGTLYLRAPPPPFARNLAGQGFERLALTTPGGNAIAYRYGTGPAVYLLHGWGGRAFQLSAFVAPLVKAGKSAVLLDAPGHGDAGGRRSSVVAFGQALAAAVAQVGPAHGVVAHSLGALGAIMALADGTPAARYVFLAPATSLEEATRRFQAIVALPAATIDRLKANMVAHFGVPWDHYDLARLKPAAPLWIAHDRADPDIPLAESEALLPHWAGAQLKVTEGLGHYRLLRNAEVVAEAVAFLGR